MSAVDNLILHVPYYLNDRTLNRTRPLEKLNAWLLERRQGVFEQVVPRSGPKGFEADVFLAVANHLHLQEFLAFFRSLQWTDPTNVQLWHKGHCQDGFTLYRAKDPP